MPHLGWVPLAPGDREASGYEFCKCCEIQEQNTDSTQDYTLQHRSGHGKSPETSSLRDSQVEHAVKTTLLAEIQKMDAQEPPIPVAKSPRPQLSSSATEEENEDNQPIESGPRPPLAHKQTGQSDSPQQAALAAFKLAQPAPQIPLKATSDRKGPGRRANHLRRDLPNPPPLPPHGERPDPKDIARYGVPIPDLPYIPGVRPSKQPARIAADLAIAKALRKCTNCHRDVDDNRFSKCSGCRRAGNERAKRYQARKKEKAKEEAEGKAAVLAAAQSQPTVEQRHHEIRPEVPVEKPQPATSSKAERQARTARREAPSSSIPTAAAATPETSHAESHAGTKERMYLALIDRHQLVHHHADSRVVVSSRGHDFNLEFLDQLTEIRLSMTTHSPERRQSPPSPQVPEACASAIPPPETEQQESPHQQRQHHTPTRRHYPHDSSGYFVLDHHHTPQVPRRMPSSSMPTPAQSSPFSPRNPQSSRGSGHPEMLQDHRFQLHPILAGVPPSEWRFLPNRHSEFPSFARDSPSRAPGQAVPPPPLGRPVPTLLSPWRASPQCLVQESDDDHEQQNSAHHNHHATLFGNSSSRNDNNNVSPGWVDGPSRESLLVDPALVSQDVDPEEVDLECWLNLSALEKSFHDEPGCGEGRGRK